MTEKSIKLRMTNEDFIRTIESLPLEEANIRIDGRIKSIYRHRKTFAWITLIICSVASIASFLFFSFNPKFQDNLSLAFGTPIIFVMYGVLLSLSIWLGALRSVNELEVEREVIKSKRNIEYGIDKSDQKINASYGEKEGYFDQLVKINLDNLSEYYKLTKISTSNSFYASLYSGIVGFGILITGIFLAYSSSKVDIGVITLVSGVIVEFISGIFFILYFRSVDKLKDYHDSLIQVQNILLSFKIMEDIKDDTERVKMANQVLTLMHGVKQP